MDDHPYYLSGSNRRAESSSMDRETMKPVSQKRTIVLGVVNTAGMKSTNANRKRRWDQPPEELEVTSKKLCVFESKKSENESHCSLSISITDKVSAVSTEKSSVVKISDFKSDNLLVTCNSSQDSSDILRQSETCVISSEKEGTSAVAIPNVKKIFAERPEHTTISSVNDESEEMFVDEAEVDNSDVMCKGSVSAVLTNDTVEVVSFGKCEPKEPHVIEARTFVSNMSDSLKQIQFYDGGDSNTDSEDYDNLNESDEEISSSQHNIASTLSSVSKVSDINQRHKDTKICSVVEENKNFTFSSSTIGEVDSNKNHDSNVNIKIVNDIFKDDEKTLKEDITEIPVLLTTKESENDDLVSVQNITDLTETVNNLRETDIAEDKQGESNLSSSSQELKVSGLLHSGSVYNELKETKKVELAREKSTPVKENYLQRSPSDSIVLQEQKYDKDLKEEFCNRYKNLPSPQINTKVNELIVTSEDEVTEAINHIESETFSTKSDEHSNSTQEELFTLKSETTDNVLRLFSMLESEKSSLSPQPEINKNSDASSNFPLEISNIYDSVEDNSNFPKSPLNSSFDSHGAKRDSRSEFYPEDSSSQNTDYEATILIQSEKSSKLDTHTEIEDACLKENEENVNSKEKNKIDLSSRIVEINVRESSEVEGDTELKEIDQEFDETSNNFRTDKVIENPVITFKENLSKAAEVNSANTLTDICLMDIPLPTDSGNTHRDNDLIESVKVEADEAENATQDAIKSSDNLIDESCILSIIPEDENVESISTAKTIDPAVIEIIFGPKENDPELNDDNVLDSVIMDSESEVDTKKQNTNEEKIVEEERSSSLIKEKLDDLSNDINSDKNNSTYNKFNTELQIEDAEFTLDTTEIVTVDPNKPLEDNPSASCDDLSLDSDNVQSDKNLMTEIDNYIDGSELEKSPFDKTYKDLNLSSDDSNDGESKTTYETAKTISDDQDKEDSDNVEVKREQSLTCELSKEETDETMESVYFDANQKEEVSETEELLEDTDGKGQFVEEICSSFHPTKTEDLRCQEETEDSLDKEIALNDPQNVNDIYESKPVQSQSLGIHKSEDSDRVIETDDDFEKHNVDCSVEELEDMEIIYEKEVLLSDSEKELDSDVIPKDQEPVESSSSERDLQKDALQTLQKTPSTENKSPKNLYDTEITLDDSQLITCPYEMEDLVGIKKTGMESSVIGSCDVKPTFKSDPINTVLDEEETYDSSLVENLGDSIEDSSYFNIKKDVEKAKEIEDSVLDDLNDELQHSQLPIEKKICVPEELSVCEKEMKFDETQSPRKINTSILGEEMTVEKEIIPSNLELKDTLDAAVDMPRLDSEKLEMVDESEELILPDDPEITMKLQEIKMKDIPDLQKMEITSEIENLVEQQTEATVSEKRDENKQTKGETVVEDDITADSKVDKYDEKDIEKQIQDSCDVVNVLEQHESESTDSILRESGEDSVINELQKIEDSREETIVESSSEVRSVSSAGKDEEHIRENEDSGFHIRLGNVCIDEEMTSDHEIVNECEEKLNIISPSINYAKNVTSVSEEIKEIISEQELVYSGEIKDRNIVGIKRRENNKESCVDIIDVTEDSVEANEPLEIKGHTEKGDELSFQSGDFAKEKEIETMQKVKTETQAIKSEEQVEDQVERESSTLTLIENKEEEIVDGSDSQSMEIQNSNKLNDGSSEVVLKNEESLEEVTNKKAMLDTSVDIKLDSQRVVDEIEDILMEEIKDPAESLSLQDENKILDVNKIVDQYEEKVIHKGQLETQLFTKEVGDPKKIVREIIEESKSGSVADTSTIVPRLQDAAMLGINESVCVQDNESEIVVIETDNANTEPSRVETVKQIDTDKSEQKDDDVNMEVIDLREISPSPSETFASPAGVVYEDSNSVHVIEEVLPNSGTKENLNQYYKNKLEQEIIKRVTDSGKKVCKEDIQKGTKDLSILSIDIDQNVNTPSETTVNSIGSDISIVPLLKTISNDEKQQKLEEDSQRLFLQRSPKQQPSPTQPKLEPITLRIYKDNLTIRTEGLDSPKKNRSPILSGELKNQLSPHIKGSPGRSSLSPQTKQLEFTLKIAKDANTNYPKATMSPKSNMSPSGSIWKSDVSPSSLSKESTVGHGSPTSESTLSRLKLKICKPTENIEILPQTNVGLASNSLESKIKCTDGSSSHSPVSQIQCSQMDEIRPPKSHLKLETMFKKMLESQDVSPLNSCLNKSIQSETIVQPDSIPHPPPTPVTPVPRKRGRPRKILPPYIPPKPTQLPVTNEPPSNVEQHPFTVPETASITHSQSLLSDSHNSNRPMRSCRGRTKPIVIRTRKPRGGGLMRGGGRGRGITRQITPDRETLTEYEKAELAKIEEKKERLRAESIARYEAKKAKKLAKKLKDEERRKRLAKEKAEKAEAAAPQVFEEETRMSAPDNSNSSRGHTPAPPVRTSNQTEPGGEESQNSISNTPSSAPNKRGRMEIPIDLECKEVRVDQLAEYHWQDSELSMIQEQISLYLGVKSFKRKYPDLKRRPVEAEERTFLEDSGLVPKSMCDLGLTAVSSAEVLDIMFHDFPDKYEEFRKFVREKQAREASSKQKALSSIRRDGSKIEPREQALEAVAAWNANLNRERKEERRCALDLQTFTVHYSKTDRDTMTRPIPKVGLYPIALIPGQYCDYYKEYTPTELMYFPLNTVLYGPLKPNERQQGGGSEDGSGSDSDSSSSDDSSDSSSEDSDTSIDPEDLKCKICKIGKKLKEDSPMEGLIQCSQCKAFVHPLCQDFSEEMLPHIKKYDWLCTDCKMCLSCKSRGDLEKILCCDLCDRGYHVECLALKKVPERWHCPNCSFCSACGTRDPGGPEWQFEFKKSDKGIKIYNRTLCVTCCK